MQFPEHHNPAETIFDWVLTKCFFIDINNRKIKLGDDPKAITFGLLEEHQDVLNSSGLSLLPLEKTITLVEDYSSSPFQIVLVDSRKFSHFLESIPQEKVLQPDFRLGLTTIAGDFSDQISAFSKSDFILEHRHLFGSALAISQAYQRLGLTDEAQLLLSAFHQKEPEIHPPIKDGGRILPFSQN